MGINRSFVPRLMSSAQASRTIEAKNLCGKPRRAVNRSRSISTNLIVAGNEEHGSLCLLRLVREGM